MRNLAYPGKQNSNVTSRYSSKWQCKWPTAINFLLSSRFKIALCDTAVSHDTAAE